MKSRKSSLNGSVSIKASHPFKMSKLALCLAPAFYTSVALGLPSGHDVVQGTAAFDQVGAQLNITNSNGAIINWQDFSIAGGEIVQFIQNNSASAVLNRVISNIPSQIQGALNSNGRVFVINPNGILIGQSAQIDVAGFVASTLNISDQDFASGNYQFKGGGGKLENRGFIATAKGGEVVLIAPTIENSGVIQSEDGQILLAAGQEVTLQSLSSADIAFRISASGNSALNLGQLLARNGTVRVFADSITQSGTVSATRAVRGADGSITLEADSGINVSGNLDASGSGVDGGTIHVLGDEVNIAGATINASGESGGEILIGGDYQGVGSVRNAANTTIDASTKISADAGQNGDGGRVIVWSDGTTRSFAAITARGGSSSGDGGFVETSGKGVLEFGQPADVSAANGEAGTWLLDPEDIYIGESEAASISDALNGGSNVEVKTSDEGDGEGNITVGADIEKTEGDEAVSLTLDAHNRVDVNASISSSAGPLSVNIKTGRQVGGGSSGNSPSSSLVNSSPPIMPDPSSEQDALASSPDTSSVETAASVSELLGPVTLGNNDGEIANFIDQEVNQLIISDDIVTAGGSVSIQADKSGDAIISSTVTTSANPDVANQQAGDITIEANRNRVDVNASISSSADPLSVNIKTGRQVGGGSSGNSPSSSLVNSSPPIMPDPSSEQDALASSPDTSSVETATLVSELLGLVTLGNNDSEIANFIDQEVNQLIISDDIVTAGGSVSIQAGESGDAIISSAITTSASADDANQHAGDITIEANRIALTDDAKLDASGEDAGTILVGGDKQGQNDQVQNAEFTYMSEQAQIKADGANNGDGGKVIVFAKNTAIVQGVITARGGAKSGDGGFIETSGLRGLRVDQAPDASASNGQNGEWLIDPFKVRVSNAGDSNISASSPFTASASGANLNIATLLAGLAAGDVTITTTGGGITTAGGGTDAGNITIENEIDLSGTSGSNSLTLQAYNDININDSITGSGSNKLTNLNLFADTDNDGSGDVNINSVGSSSKRVGTLNIDVLGNANINSVASSNKRVGTLNIDVLGNVNIDGNTENVTIIADTSIGYGGNIAINAGGGFNVGSASNKLDGDFVLRSMGGGTGESVQIISNTLTVQANGDFDLLDGAQVNSGKEVRSTSAQTIDVRNLELRGQSNGGAILRLTGAGSQTIRTSGTLDVIAGSEAPAIIDTQLDTSSQNITSEGKLTINFSGDTARIDAANSQTITVGTASTPSELEILGGGGATNNGRIQAAGTQSITVNGNLKLTKGDIIGGSGTTSVTTDDLRFTQGLIDLNTGTLTINGGGLGSMIDGIFNAQINDATIVNASGSTINHLAGSFILNNSTFNNQGIFNNQGGTLRLDSSTFNNTSTASLSGGMFDFNASTFSNTSTFNWNGSGTNIDVDSDSIFSGNTSSIVNDSASSSFTSPASNFSNSGNYNKTAGTTTFNAGFQNTGTVTVNGGATLDFSGTDRSYSQSAGKTVTNGTVNAGANSMAFAGGRIEGAGNLNGTMITAANTTFAPGNSVGTLNVGGDLNLSGGGNVFQIEVEGAGIGEFDRVNVAGSLIMPTTNSVNVSFINGYTGPAMIGDMETLTNVISTGITSLVNPTVNPGGDAGLTVTNTAGLTTVASTAVSTSTSLDITYQRVSEIPTGTGEEIIEEMIETPVTGITQEEEIPLLFIVIEESENERDQTLIVNIEEPDSNEDGDNDDEKKKVTNMCLVV